MQSVVIVPLMDGDEFAGYRAIAGSSQSDGETVGQALDALRAQHGATRAGGIVVVESFAPDQFFSAAQQERLQLLMQKWRKITDAGEVLSADERAELASLVDAELAAAVKRAQNMLPRSDS